MIRSAVFILTLLALSGLVGAAPPNVILIMSDDQGYGDLGCHGNPVIRTPHLDRLHGESVRFTDFHVAPMCTPTRGQLMTGVDALRNKAMNVSSGRALLRPDLPTLPALLAQAGYATGIFGKWHLGDNHPFRPQDRGFEESVWFPSSHIGSVPDVWNNDYFDDTYMHNGRRKSYRGYTTDVFFTEAMAWMKQCQASSRPFFTYLPTAAPHGPFYVPEKYRQALLPRLEAAASKLRPYTPKDRENVLRFLAMIENLDENMGRLDAFLQAEGLRENTLLIFLTDNGSTMGHRYYNAGMKGSKTTLWEGGHRVPLFMRWPQGSLGDTRDEPALAHVQDLLPTVLDLCGAKDRTPDALDGLSLAPLLRKQVPELPERMLVINYSRMPINRDSAAPDSPSVPKKEGAAVLWKNWRLLEDRELYNVQADPLQTRGVAAANPEVVGQMRKHLNAWWAGVKDQVNEPERVVIGSDRENPCLLTACEWWDVFVDQQFQIRRGEPKNGIWRLQVAASGTYELLLRRWPAESGLALQSAAPEETVTDGVLLEGKPLPIHMATVSAQRQTLRQTVQDGAASVSFRLPLIAGPCELATTFQDANGRALCGAYYVEVRKID